MATSKKRTRIISSKSQRSVAIKAFFLVVYIGVGTFVLPIECARLWEGEGNGEHVGRETCRNADNNKCRENGVDVDVDADAEWNGYV
jgi:hypothetical protein